MMAFAIAAITLFIDILLSLLRHAFARPLPPYFRHVTVLRFRYVISPHFRLLRFHFH
jgi:hypothetical protein